MKTLLLALVSIVSFSSFAQAGSCVPWETQIVENASLGCVWNPTRCFVDVNVLTKVQYCNGQIEEKREIKRVNQPSYEHGQLSLKMFETGTVFYKGPASDMSAE